MPDEFLTVAEIAELLKLNGQTIRNWIDRGELPAVRVAADGFRVRRSDLDAFLEATSTSRADAGSRESIPLSPAPESFAGLREIAVCAICHVGQLTRTDSPPEWYVLEAATLGLPDDEEKRVGRGVPVSVSVCSRCEHVALFLPPTIDRPTGSGAG